MPPYLEPALSSLPTARAETSRKLVLLGGALLCLLGCAGYVRAPYDPSATGYLAIPATTSPFPFFHEREPVPVDNHHLTDRETDLYEIRHLTFPSVAENGQPDNLFVADYHQSKLPGRKPVVLVLPIWGSATYPSSKTVRSIRRHSEGRMDLVNVLGPEPLFHWRHLARAETEEAFRREVESNVDRVLATIRDLRRLVDWLETQPKADIDRIGIVGFSMGALVAAPLLTADHRFESSVLVMGGARPHTVAARCGGHVGGTRRTITARFGWTRDYYERSLEELFAPLDTARYPGRVDPGGVLIVDADRDGCMPEQAREDLWTVLGKPERLTYNYGHRTSFLAMTPLGFHSLSRKIYRFLADRLLPADGEACCIAEARPPHQATAAATQTTPQPSRAGQSPDEER